MYKALLTLFAVFCLGCAGTGVKEVEIREYQGQRLDRIDRQYDNSIKGPQRVNRYQYRLAVDGLVEEPREFTYDQVLETFPSEQRLITMYCVEGWKEVMLWKGPRLTEIIASAKPKPGVTTVIFHAEDGYTSSLDFDLVVEKDLLMASHLNGLRLNMSRGFPFQIVAEDRLGYKWVRWVTRIELSDEPYYGFWEQRGYSNEAIIEDRESFTGPPE